MPASPPSSPFLSNVPAIVLALVLLGAFAVTGLRAAVWLRTAPSTPLPLQALPENRHRPAGEAPIALRRESGPAWSELTTAQKEALYPLVDRWSLLSELQKRHWLKLAAGFAALAPDEQQKWLVRLTDWASLSAQQRSQARLNYAATSRLAPDSKRAKWEAYQALSEEERKRLAAKAAPRPPTGAAPAVRGSAKKLAHVPAASAAPATLPNPPKIPRPSVQHVPQALPVPPPALAPAPPPVVVETKPVETPSARPTALPPLLLEETAPAPEPPISGSMEPVHPPQ
ncbi:Protein of unknown function [Oryzisolibacter propanilivorax]|uniref:DUF3106 domain-containing protein n=1 Tax=Oryzisolibacter propanilivorax TaxID=1527607 RepID=A0A1G9PM96_9BURK|nr:DUF3106 domain-containing protein [Oryzisolibacter propanilivorax]SDL99936.1 Protein of unknown function [Oryzisolibacter propanilivorax]